MIKEEYVSFYVAKLLKEKGFNEPTIGTYNIESKNPILIERPIRAIHCEAIISAPTHQMAMAWLRKKHKIMITIIPQEVSVGVDSMCYAIYRITEDLYQPLCNGKVDNLVDSYEEAVESALKYSLKNLI